VSPSVLAIEQNGQECFGLTRVQLRPLNLWQSLALLVRADQKATPSFIVHLLAAPPGQTHHKRDRDPTG
jgi:hypothetical protein